MSDKFDKSVEQSAKVMFDNGDDAIKFLNKDCGDTYKDLVDTKGKRLTPRQKKKLRNKTNFAENKNAAVATLVMFYEGAISYIEQELAKFKEKQKELVAFNKNNV